MTDLSKTYAQQLWSLGLGIAAFTIVQTITFAFALKDASFGGAVAKGWFIVLPSTWACTVAYIWAIWWVDKLQLELLNPSEVDVALVVRTVRKMKIGVVVACAIAVTALTILAWYIAVHPDKVATS